MKNLVVGLMQKACSGHTQFVSEYFACYLIFDITTKEEVRCNKTMGVRGIPTICLRLVAND